MDLKDYYLVKCFTAQKYRDDFNNGVDIHINNNRIFWKKENTFQQDLEGVIFRQNGNGYLFVPKKGCEPIIEKIMKNPPKTTSKQMMEILADYIDVLGSTTDLTISVDGYICCFYLLPKKDIRFDITDNSIAFSDEVYENILNYIADYARENKKHGEKSYVSIYDAYTFMLVFSQGFKSKGYSIKYGIVSYSDVTVEKKIEALKNSDYKTLIFTKPTKYSYQNEFRIFLPQKDDVLKDYLSESGIDMRPSVVASFVYG